MINTLLNLLTNFVGVFKIILGVLIAAGLISFSGVTFIPNSKVGIVEKLLGGKDRTGGIIALNGEAGFQAKVLRGGWYFRFRGFYKVHKVDLITVPAGQIGYVYARDGQKMPGDQILGRQVECHGFEDVESFLNNGGQKGPQTEILNAGTYAINLAQFVILCENGIHALSLGTEHEKEIIKNIDQMIRERNGYRPVIIEGDMCGIVTVHDGPALPAGELVAARVDNHNSYQRPQDFLNNGGMKGIQLDPITNGTYFINALFATVEIIKKYEIPIGMVGVVNYFTGKEGEDLSGEEYNHGELVENGTRGVWVKPLEANKYAWNPYAGKIYPVPTTNFVLKWQRQETSELGYDDKLEEVSLITKDAFQPALPLSVVIHIDYTDASKVIQRFGDIHKLITET
ncbi:MAG: flotillin family protein, partial [Clostridia bacterium]|nr:flotillin family protein [Clostridia bacterium]